jgi:hypothetical protein
MHFDVHDHAAEDLARIAEAEPEAAATILATLEQLEADPGAIDKLTTYGNIDVGGGQVNIDRWITASRRARRGDLWRFRALDTPATNYRVVYGYHWQTRQVCVLAIVHKEKLNYDDLQSGIGQRVLSDWANL